MIKRFSSQEIFIILSAFSVLLFMYATIIISAPINEFTERNDQQESDIVLDSEEGSAYSAFAFLHVWTEEDHE